MLDTYTTLRIWNRILKRKMETKNWEPTKTKNHQRSATVFCYCCGLTEEMGAASVDKAPHPQGSKGHTQGFPQGAVLVPLILCLLLEQADPTSLVIKSSFYTMVYF